MKERRRAPRFKINQLIGITIGREEYLEAEGLDLSESGILCLTESILEIGESIFLMFEMDGRTIRCDGITVRAEPDHDERGFISGIKFTGIEIEDTVAIKKYLDTLY